MIKVKIKKINRVKIMKNLKKILFKLKKIKLNKITILIIHKIIIQIRIKI